MYIANVSGIMTVSSGVLYPNVKKIFAELTGLPLTYLSEHIYTNLNNLQHLQIYSTATEMNILYSSDLELRRFFNVFER